MRLILIRHGASAHQRYLDSGLTELGVQQIERLAARVPWRRELEGRLRLLSSPLPRAMQSAELLRPALPAHDYRVESALREVDDGVGSPPAEGEAFRHFLARVRQVLDALAGDSTHESVLCVTHAGVIAASLATLLAEPSAGRQVQLYPAHANITEWRVQGCAWTLVRYNCDRL